MPQISRNSQGVRNFSNDISGSTLSPGFSPQDAVPVLYPAVQPSKTLEVDAAGAAINADLSSTLGALSLTSTATVIVAATESSTLGTLTLTSAGTLPIVANESSTLGLLSLSSAGTLPVAANLSDTLGLLGLSAAGADIVAANLNQTLGLLGLASDGTVVGGGAVNADLSVTLGSLVLSADAVALEHEPGGTAGYLKREKMYYRGANLMLEPMSESTRRAERIMAGWRDEEEAMMLVQIIETFYD